MELALTAATPPGTSTAAKAIGYGQLETALAMDEQARTAKQRNAMQASQQRRKERTLDQEHTFA